MGDSLILQFAFGFTPRLAWATRLLAPCLRAQALPLAERIVYELSCSDVHGVSSRHIVRSGDSSRLLVQSPRLTSAATLLEPLALFAPHTLHALRSVVARLT